MNSNDLNDIFDACLDAAELPDTYESNFAKDIAMILDAMGIEACDTGSGQICSGIAFGFFGSCGGVDASESCEQIVANFNRTLTQKKSLNCFITNRESYITNQTTLINTINLDLSGVVCCKCLAEPPETRCDECIGISEISQTNNANVTASTYFEVDEAEAIIKKVSETFEDELNNIIGVDKEGLGADAGQKNINFSEFINMTSDASANLRNNVQTVLNQLTAENVMNFKIDPLGRGYTSYGPCFGSINQTNIVEHVILTVYSEILNTLVDSLDDITYTKVVENLLQKDVTGTDIAGMFASFDTMEIIGFVIVFLVIAFIGYQVFKSKQQTQMMLMPSIQPRT